MLKMRKSKSQKGITLIALIITIVVLLILATVAINAITEYNIIDNANSAVQNYSEQVGKEDETLGNYDSIINQYLGGLNKEEIQIPIGSYVEYDVSYIDMYQGIQYTKTNGWRYLGIDDAGNKLLVSTAIPAIVYYNYWPATLPTWWATDAEVQADTGMYKTTAGWDYNNSGYPNKYAAYGLRYKFESIPFTYQASGTSVSSKNTGIFRQVGSTTSGTSLNLNFKANGVNVKKVHNLTLAEVNRAMNSVTGGSREETSKSSGFKDLTGDALGIFDMQDLTGYTASYYYWLASPSASNTSNVYYVGYNYSDVRGVSGHWFRGSPGSGSII